MQSIIEPNGAVPKKSKDEFRDISDTSTGTKTITKLGTLLFTAWDLASSMCLLSFLNCHDISNGYHILMLTYSWYTAGASSAC